LRNPAITIIDGSVLPSQFGPWMPDQAQQVVDQADARVEQKPPDHRDRHDAGHHRQVEATRNSLNPRETLRNSSDTSGPS
jgi:hypothetical protein